MHPPRSASENFSRDVSLSLGGEDKAMMVRLYKNRDGSFDGVAYAQGRAPRAASEVALDRVFCSNHDLGLGDTVQIAGEDFELVGICTLSDYQATYKNAGDFMFNATTFTVVQLTDEEWERLVGDGATFRYSVVLNDRGMDLAGRVSFEEDLVDAVNENGSTVTDLIDRESNIGLTFASDDVESDSRMWEILMLALVVIMAFVFVVLTDATIEQESAVIGTLLASGYRKREGPWRWREPARAPGLRDPLSPARVPAQHLPLRDVVLWHHVRQPSSSRQTRTTRGSTSIFLQTRQTSSKPWESPSKRCPT